MKSIRLFTFITSLSPEEQACLEPFLKDHGLSVKERIAVKASGSPFLNGDTMMLPVEAACNELMRGSPMVSLDVVVLNRDHLREGVRIIAAAAQSLKMVIILEIVNGMVHEYPLFPPSLR